MLNIVSLVEAVQGNSFGGYTTGEPYQFYGSIHECTAEFNHLVMVEDADMQGFLTSADEVMVEAALSRDTYRMDRLSEGVFENIKDGLSKFFEKLKKFVRGLIDKIKAFFYKLTGKTNKWLGVMKEKILAAVKLSGATDTVYEMHKWNIQYVTTDLLAGVQGMLEFAEGPHTIPLGNKTTKKLASPEEMQMWAKAVIAERDNDVVMARAKSKDPGVEEKTAREDAREKIKDEVKAALDDINEAKSTFDDKWPEQVGEAVGVGTGSGSLDAVWSDVARKAKGDSSEKTEVKFCSEWGVDSMIQAIDSTSKTISNLKSGYDKHLTKLEKIHKSWDQALSKLKVNNENKMDNTAVAESRSAITAAVGYVTHTISACETAANTARGANIKFVQDMSHEFMNALTKLAAYKSEKK